MAERWLKLDGREITTDDVLYVLGQVDNDLWVISACVDCVVDNPTVQRALLDLGLSRSDLVVERCANIVSLSSRHTEALVAHFENAPEDAQICYLRSILLQRLDRLNTYVELEKSFPKKSGLDFNEGTKEWEGDPWIEGNDTTSNEPITKPPPSDSPPILLSKFLRNDLLWSACEIASATAIDALQILLQRHGRVLWPSRFKILQCFSECTEPSICRHLLPSLNHDTNAETVLVQNTWRSELDLVELPETRAAFIKISTLPTQSSQSTKAIAYNLHLAPMTPLELSTWYKNRVNLILYATGMINVALSLVQHGASQGIPSLDELGEDLSLVSRLVYDAPHGEGVEEDWTLAHWYSMEPMAVVNAYLAHSTPATLVRDIWRLVMPYLYVLEAKAERAGHPDPMLHTRILYDYILTTSLENVAAIFEASKPTLPVPQRLIKNDEDMSRLALACLYGNTDLNNWATMSGIFECLPVWELSRDDDGYAASVDATLASLATIVVPSAEKPPPLPRDLVKFFEPMSFILLSKALDMLDVHLESGEILSRWHVAAPLRWFLQSSADVSEQRAWANKMARRGKGTDDRLNSVEEWERLLKDMVKLTGSGDPNARGAFCLLTNEEVMRIFLDSLLTSGYFSIAKTMIYGSSSKLTLSPEAIESASLACSRELYDNAQSGNYKTGDMKLAYECLDVPRPSDTLTKEREFIEATSRITSFNIVTRHSTPMSPVEIRLTKDRLSLISGVLSSNRDAYKHAEVVLELCNKLGYRDDKVAEVKVLAMLADTALQTEDFDYAYGSIERMIALVSSLRSTYGESDDKAREAAGVCWVACFQLGRQSEFLNLSKKMALLGNALELCPSDKIHDVLTAWRKLETENVQERAGQARRPQHIEQKMGQPNRPSASLRARLQDFHMPGPPLLSSPDTAALASRTFKTMAATFPFTVGHRRSDTLRGEGSGRMDGEDVSSQASRVLSKGIGWLIGAEDDM